MQQLGTAWEEERRELAASLNAMLRESVETERREACMDLLRHLRRQSAVQFRPSQPVQQSRHPHRLGLPAAEAQRVVCIGEFLDRQPQRRAW